MKLAFNKNSLRASTHVGCAGDALKTTPNNLKKETKVWLTQPSFVQGSEEDSQKKCDEEPTKKRRRRRRRRRRRKKKTEQNQFVEPKRQYIIQYVPVPVAYVPVAALTAQQPPQVMMSLLYHQTKTEAAEILRRAKMREKRNFILDYCSDSSTLTEVLDSGSDYYLSNDDQTTITKEEKILVKLKTEPVMAISEKEKEIVKIKEQKTSELEKEEEENAHEIANCFCKWCKRKDYFAKYAHMEDTRHPVMKLQNTALFPHKLRRWDDPEPTEPTKEEITQANLNALNIECESGAETEEEEEEVLEVPTPFNWKTQVHDFNEENMEHLQRSEHLDKTWEETSVGNTTMKDSVREPTPPMGDDRDFLPTLVMHNIMNIEWDLENPDSEFQNMFAPRGAKSWENRYVNTKETMWKMEKQARQLVWQFLESHGIRHCCRMKVFIRKDSWRRNIYRTTGTGFLTFEYKQHPQFGNNLKNSELGTRELRQIERCAAGWREAEYLVGLKEKLCWKSNLVHFSWKD